MKKLDQRFGDLDDHWRGVLEDQPQVDFELQTAAAQTEMALQETLTEMAAIRKARREHAIPGAFVAVLGLITAGVAAWQYVSEALVVRWELLAAGSAIALIAGVVMLVIAARVQSDAHREVRLRRGELLERREALTLRTEANDRQLDSLARAVGYADAPALLDEWSQAVRLEFAREPARRLAGELAELDAQYAAASERAGSPKNVEFLDEAAEGIRARTLQLERRAAHAQHLEAARGQLAEVRKRIAELEGHARRILESVGVDRPPDDAWGTLVAEVGRREHAARRHRSLSDDIIPRVREGILDGETVEQNEQTVAMFEADAAEDRAAGIAPPAPFEGPAPTLAELARHGDAVRARLDALHRERGELRMRVEEVLRRYHREHSEKLTEREQCERARLKAQRFKASVDLARETIQQVALETHRRWAEFLNDRVAKLLDTVGTGVEHVRFGEDLDFAVKPERGQQVSRGKAVRQLSSGARDQLHLAVRLAISEYLSREEPLPLLIDDCFATSDDRRAGAGMNLLIEQFSEHHQVILVTCHRQRAETLAAAAGDLYPRRVHWIDTQSMRAGAPVEHRREG